jgi:bifunctional lysine-specific demethylase and histidyl-hydroxylase NO66
MMTANSGAGEALRRCVPLSPQAFAEQYWDREPLLSKRLDDFSDLLSLADVDELLSRRGLRAPFIRMAKQGRLIPTEQFTGGGGLGAEVGDQVLDERVFALLNDGATLVLQGLHRLWPPLIDFATALRADVGSPVQINAYLTPPGNQGFATHYDTHSVFVLQVAGRKRWRVHPPVVADPIDRQPWGGHADEVAAVAAEAPTIDRVLVPGDALYLPRGWLHAAESLDELSLHLTIGLRAPTRHTLVKALFDLAVDDLALRSGLPMGTDPSDAEALAPVLADTVKAMHAWLDRVTADDVADRLRPSTWAAARPAPIRPLAQAMALAALDLNTRVALRPGLPARVEHGDDGVTVRLPDRTVTFPAFCGDAIAAVLDGNEHRVGDLPGLDVEDRLVLARRLVRETALVALAAE